MIRFRDLSIKYKILLGYCVVLAVFLILGLYFIYTSDKISKLSRHIETQSFTEVEFTTILTSTLADMGFLSHEVEESTVTESRLDENKKKLAIGKEKFEVILLEYAELVKGKADIFPRVEEMRGYFQKYAVIIDKKIEEKQKGVFLTNQEEGILEMQLNKAINDLHDEEVVVLSSDLAYIDHLSIKIRQTYLWMFVVMFCLSVIVSCGIARIVVGPIRDLVLAQRRLGSGDLDYKIEVRNNDEIGILQNGFMSMAQRLKQVYADLYQERDGLEAKVKEHTRELEKVHRYLTEITNGIEEGIMLLDRDFKVLWANKKISEVTDIKSGDLLGKFCYAITHKLQEPCRPPNCTCPVVEAIRTGKSITEVHKHYDKEGKQFYAEVTAYPLKDENGEIRQFVHVSKDVTERIKLESQLKEALEVMQAKIAEMEMFHKLTIDREIRMVELKEKIEELEQRSKEKT